MPSVIIVDDESGARRGLRRLLECHEDVRMLGEAESVQAAKALIAAEMPDLVFLDVEMPGGMGFDLLAALAPETRVVFITAHSQHAVKAFEVEALDYLLKPFDPTRLDRALDRARRQLKPDVPDNPARQPENPLTLRDGRRTLQVPISSIAALAAEGDLTRFLISGGKPVLISQTIGRYAEMLPSPPFIRLSRSLVVNLNAVESLESLSRDASCLVLKGISPPIELRRIAAIRLRDALGRLA